MSKDKRLSLQRKGDVKLDAAFRNFVREEFSKRANVDGMLTHTEAQAFAKFLTKGEESKEGTSKSLSPNRNRRLYSFENFYHLYSSIAEFEKRLRRGSLALKQNFAEIVVSREDENLRKLVRRDIRVLLSPPSGLWPTIPAATPFKTQLPDLIVPPLVCTTLPAEEVPLQIVLKTLEDPVAKQSGAWHKSWRSRWLVLDTVARTLTFFKKERKKDFNRQIHVRNIKRVGPLAEQDSDGRSHCFIVEEASSEEVTTYISGCADEASRLAWIRNIATLCMLQALERNASIDTVRSFVEAGAEVNVADPGDEVRRSPLLIAMMSGQRDVAELLLRRGANGSSLLRWSYLRRFCSNGKGNDSNVYMNGGGGIAGGARNVTALSVAELLSRNDHKLNLIGDDIHEWSLLHYACLQEDTRGLEIILDSVSLNCSEGEFRRWVNHRNATGDTALAITLKQLGPHAVTLALQLLEKGGAALDIADGGGHLPLHLAIKGRAGRNFDSTLDELDSDKKSAVALACKMIELGADLNAKDPFGDSSFFLAVKLREELLLRQMAMAHSAVAASSRSSYWKRGSVNSQRRVDTNTRDANGDTPLLWAAKRSDVALCQIILDLGADSSATDPMGNSALSSAVLLSHEELGCLLVDFGALGGGREHPWPIVEGLRIENDATIHVAIKKRLTRLSSKLVEMSPTLLFERDSAGDTPLLLAMRTHQYVLASQLASIKVDKRVPPENPELELNWKNQNGSKVAYPNERPISFLDMTAPQEFGGDTALLLALRAAQLELAVYLLKCGADPNKCDSGSTSPLHVLIIMATMLGTKEVAMKDTEESSKAAINDVFPSVSNFLFPVEVVVSTTVTIIKMGARLNVPLCDTLHTPLHLIALYAYEGEWSGVLTLAEAFLEADVSVASNRDVRGNTPLMLALSGGLNNMNNTDNSSGSNSNSPTRTSGPPPPIPRRIRPRSIRRLKGQGGGTINTPSSSSKNTNGGIFSHFTSFLKSKTSTKTLSRENSFSKQSVRMEMVDLLSTLGRTDFNITNKSGDSVLHIAVRAGDAGVVRYLLSSKYKVKAKMRGGKGSDSFKSKLGRSNVRLPGPASAEGRSVPNADLWNLSGYAPIHIAAMAGDIDVLSVFGTCGCNLDRPTEFGETALMLALARGHGAAMKTLVNSGASLQLRMPSTRNTLLHVGAFLAANASSVDSSLDENQALKDMISIMKATNSDDEKWKFYASPLRVSSLSDALLILLEWAEEIALSSQQKNKSGMTCADAERLIRLFLQHCNSVTQTQQVVDSGVSEGNNYNRQRRVSDGKSKLINLLRSPSADNAKRSKALKLLLDEKDAAATQAAAEAGVIAREYLKYSHGKKEVRRLAQKLQHEGGGANSRLKMSAKEAIEKATAMFIAGKEEEARSAVISVFESVERNLETIK
eukprot:g3783.t1